VSVELKKVVLRALMANLSDTFENRCYYAHLFSKIPRRYSVSFFRTSCHRTGTGRSVFRSFKYSRHELKRLSAKGLVMGFRKSSF
jgi:ribosomal protein S14